MNTCKGCGLDTPSCVCPPGWSIRQPTRFLADTPYADSEEAFSEGARIVWATIADDVTSGLYEAGETESEDTCDLAVATSSTLDLGCFDQYCGLEERVLRQWHDLIRHPKGYELKYAIVYNALRGHC